MQTSETKITPSEPTAIEQAAKIATTDLLPREPLLTPTQVASILKTSAGVLAVDRCMRRRRSLRFVRQGRRIFYRTADVATYIDSLK